MRIGPLWLLGTVLLAVTGCVESGAGGSAPPATPDSPSPQTSSPTGDSAASPAAVPPAASTDSSVVPAPAKANRFIRVPAIVLAGSSILAAYAGALLLIGAESGDARVRRLDAQIKDACPEENPEPAGLCGERLAAIQDTNRLRSLGIDMLLAGGVLGAGAGVFLVLFPQEEAQGSKPPSNVGVRVVPFARAGTGGVILQGSF